MVVNIKKNEEYTSYHFILAIIYFSGILRAKGNWQYLFEQGFYELKQKHPKVFNFSDSGTSPVFFNRGRYNDDLHYSKAIEESLSDLSFAGIVLFDQFGLHTFTYSFYIDPTEDENIKYLQEKIGKDLEPFKILAREFVEIIIKVKEDFPDEFEKCTIVLAEKVLKKIEATTKSKK